MNRSMVVPQNVREMFKMMNDIRSSESSTGLRELSKEQKTSDSMCRYCKEDTLVEEDGVLVCTDCGRENDAVITNSQEWRSFSENAMGKDDPARCGMPVNPLLPQSSLGTVISGKGSESYRKLQLQNAMPSSEKTLWEAIKNIRDVAQKGQIPGVIADKGCLLYAALSHNEKLKRGNSRRGLQAYCMYVFCKAENSGCFISPERLSELFGISATEFREGQKMFSEISYRKSMNQIPDTAWSEKFRSSRREFVKPTNPENYVQRAGVALNLKEEQIAEVVYIVRTTEKLALVAKKMPQSIAAGCIILYVKEKKLKIPAKRISEICGVSDITAGSTFKELKQYKKYLFPSTSEELVDGKMGDCRPPKKLETIYKAPSSAIPPTMRLIKSREEK